MDEMSRSMAALRVDKSNLEERLAVEKVCEICHSDTKNMKQYGAVEFAVEYIAKNVAMLCYHPFALEGGGDPAHRRE